MPEVGGPIDPANEAHDMITGVFGGLSKGERNRIRIRPRRHGCHHCHRRSVRGVSLLERKGRPDGHVRSAGRDLFGAWVERRHSGGVPHCGDETGLRFAFYGRTSTVDYQDRWSSAGWQREAAESVIAGRGVIVAEFFDAGCSRRMSWARRPQAAALLSALADQDRPFDAIVVGEFERAFSGDEFRRLVPLLDSHGVQVWLPEAGGPIDMSAPAHRALMLMLGAQSQREVLRARHRVLAAMRTQVRDQGRFQGGRPPYGYWLVDAGPHPNRAHARWGRRLQRLDPDPATAPHVQWMFAQRMAARSVAGIARELNERGVPCPSSVDRARNRHRSAEQWTERTVAEILGNPRYTGRQVWNRRGSCGNERNWAVSKTAVHPALVSEGDFVAVQAIRAARPALDGSIRSYLLAGLLRCGVCLRRMDSHWVNGRAGYRCRHGNTSAKRRAPDGPKTLYLREDRLLAIITAQCTDPTATDPDELVTSLRLNGQVIICDAKTCVVTGPNQKAPGSTFVI